MKHPNKKQRSPEQFENMVHEIDRDGDNLTEWEVEFIAGFIDGGMPEDPTEKQWEVLQRIYDERL